MNINLGSIESQAHQYYMRAPNVYIQSYDANSVTFKVKNNSSGDSARVYYDVGESSPTAYSQELDPGETSSNITLSGLSSGTYYTVHARTKYGGTYSSTNGSSFTTTSATVNPTISNVVSGADAMNYPHYYVSWRVYNNDPDTATMYSDIGISDPVSSHGSKENGDYVACYETGFSMLEMVTIYAKANASGKVESDVVSSSHRVE